MISRFARFLGATLLVAALIVGLWVKGATGQSTTAEPDPAEPDPVEPDPAEPDPAEPDPAEPDPAEPDAAEVAPDATGAEGQGPEADQRIEPDLGAVPCDVAMVVGCVAVVDGPQGPVTVSLPSSTQLQTAGGAARGGQGLVGEPAEATTATEPEEEGPDDRPVRSGVDPWERGGLEANFGTGSIPVSQYQIGADVNGWLGVPDPMDSLVASQTNWVFTTSTFLVILATNALDWAFEFPLAETLVGDAGILAQDYSVNYFGFGLSNSAYSLALTVTMLVAGFKAVTKGLVVAGSEVLLGVAAYVVLIVLTLTSGFGDAGLAVARVSAEVSGGIATFAAGADRQVECAQAVTSTAAGSDGADGDAGGGPVDGTSSACTFGYAVQRSLVELPYQNLQWGQVLDGVPGKEQCAAINRQLLEEGPWGNDDEPRNRMRDVAECEENADFNHQASYIRLGTASANTIIAAIVTMLLLAVSAMLLWQQIKLLFLTVTMPHALVFAILPGRSRRLAWLWVEHLLGVVIRTVVLSLGLVVWLSLFSLVVHEQLTARGIFLSLFASMAMAVGGLYGLYRLASMTRRVAPPTGRPPEQQPTAVTNRITISEDADHPGGGTRRITTVTQATPRSVRMRSATIGGGPGDRPGGGAAAKPLPAEMNGSGI